MRTETGLSEIQVLTGNSRELLPSLPEESIQCCVTSPPYWGLRDYDHPAQIGAEPSPDQYVSDLVEIFRQVRRVLKRGGTIWLNVGDGDMHAIHELEILVPMPLSPTPES